MIARSVGGLLLIAVFCLTVGDFSRSNLLLGGALAGTLAFCFRRWLFTPGSFSATQTRRAMLCLPSLIGFILGDILRGTWQVATTAAGVRRQIRPGIVGLSVRGVSARGRAFTGLALTLSPGSVLVDTDETREIMWFHLIQAPDPESERRRYQNKFQKHQRCIVP